MAALTARPSAFRVASGRGLELCKAQRNCVCAERNSVCNPPYALQPRLHPQQQAQVGFYARQANVRAHSLNRNTCD